MNRFCLIALAVALFGCKSVDSGEVRPAPVLWMEWPQTVQLGQPFQLRVVIPPLCSHGNLDVRQVQAGDVLALEARWIDVRPSEWGCEPAGPIYDFSTIDVEGISGSPRSLELRATAGAEGLPRDFGTLALVTSATSVRILAAGYARFVDGSSSCRRIRPAGTSSGLPPSPDSYLLSGSPPDTVTAERFWVEGYFEPATGTCASGDALAFRVVSYSASPN